MRIQELLDLLTAASADKAIIDTAAFIAYLRTPDITSLTDPFERLVHASIRAGSQSNAGIAGHQTAVRESWNVSRHILTVAARARDQRRSNVWHSLGDELPV